MNDLFCAFDLFGEDIAPILMALSNPVTHFTTSAGSYRVMIELPHDQTGVTIEKSQSTITKNKHYLNRWVLPKWQKERALAVRAFEVEDWFKQIEREYQLETATLAEIRKVMNLVFRHGILLRRDEGNPMAFVRLPGDRDSIIDSEREDVA